MTALNKSVEKGKRKMKKVAILVCNNAVGEKCTGAGCIKAFNKKTGTFEKYRTEEVELQAFFQCNGCDKSLEEDEELKKKVERIVEIHPDAVHVGICTINKEHRKHCETIKKMAQIFQDSGIEVVSGTHDSEILKMINDI
ncbi:MAG: CGGC domain-containing protein [Eubacteriales bacterium]|nr:CGGC domain-containing protein [Eubacteriales bacterium]